VQLHQLAYFVAVADQRHFTRAAESLHVAQPSLSQQIRALESDLGARLFTRAPGRVALTAAGEELLPLARRILADAGLVRRVVREVDDLDRGRVRLGATPSLCTSLLPRILADFRRDYPGVTLLVTEGGSRDLQQGLTEGALDLALIIDSRVAEDSRLQARPLFTEELVAISAADAPAALPERITVADLQGRPMVMFRVGYDLRETTVAACRAAGFEPTLAVEGGEMDAVLAFVAAGLGLAVVPSAVADERFRVTRFSGPGLLRTVHLAARSDVEAPPAAKQLQRMTSAFLAGQAADDALPLGVRALEG
jgi:DNA-binding transcriptional LysR family regulator